MFELLGLWGFRVLGLRSQLGLLGPQGLYRGFGFFLGGSLVVWGVLVGVCGFRVEP